MRRLIKIAVLLGLVWSGIWVAADYGLKRGIDQWFAAQRARGWQAEQAGIDGAGYPLRHVIQIVAPALADPGTGAAWRADWLRLDSPAIWPGRQTLTFPDSDQRLSVFDRTSVLRATGMQARLDLRPGRALPLDRLELRAGDWRLRTPDGAVMGADGLLLSMVQQGAPEDYRLTFSAPDFTPGGALRLAAAAGAALPPGFDALDLQATVRFDRPWDRRALEERRPQPRALLIDQADIRWGDLTLSARGALDIDPQGRPHGTIALRAENWRRMLDMSVAAGALSQQQAEPLARVLVLLAGTGDDSDTLDTELRFAEGLMLLGPLPLGPAPVLRLH